MVMRLLPGTIKEASGPKVSRTAGSNGFHPGEKVITDDDPNTRGLLSSDAASVLSLHGMVYGADVNGDPYTPFMRFYTGKSRAYYAEVWVPTYDWVWVENAEEPGGGHYEQVPNGGYTDYVYTEFWDDVRPYNATAVFTGINHLNDDISPFAHGYYPLRFSNHLDEEVAGNVDAQQSWTATGAWVVHLYPYPNVIVEMFGADPPFSSTVGKIHVTRFPMPDLGGKVNKHIPMFY